MPNLIVPINEKDHTQGPESASVTLVEYGDYQCNVCKLTVPIIKQLQRELGDRLRFVFRHFPLKQAHPLAQMAAETAEAAALQNKFWEMHFLLFDKQAQLDATRMNEFAKTLNLDLNKFEADIHSPDVLKTIETDFQTGVRSGVNGTPCFYINGNRYDGDASYVAFKQALLTQSSAS